MQSQNEGDHLRAAVRAVNSVALSLLNLSRLEDLLQDALKRVLEVMETEAGAVHLLDEQDRELRLVAHIGLPQSVVADADRYRLGEGLPGWVAQTGEPVMVYDLRSDSRVTRRMARAEGYRSFVAVPLKTQLKTYGAIQVLTHERRSFLPEDIEILRAIGTQIGLGIENGRLILELRQKMKDESIKQRRLKDEVNRLRSSVGETFLMQRLVGQSQPMEALRRAIYRVAATNSPVLLLGESGVGKELVAKAIHALSNRAGRPFVAVNCGALPEPIQETELFGYRKGSFTGAASDRKGLTEEADQGVLFLDEVGETSLPLQVKLLRFLEDGEIRRVGDCRSVRADVRVISATNSNLQDAIRRGSFRSDLYYRLNVLSVTVPPLRDRVDDIPVLATHFLDQFARKYAQPIRGISEHGIEQLKSYEWPGNVRELQNVLERAVTFTAGDLIEEIDLPRGIMADGREVTHSLVHQEHVRTLEAMQKYQWNRRKAAKALGISRTTLWRKLRTYGVG